MLKKTKLYLLLFISLFFTNNVLADYPQTPKDYLLLPPYCKARASSYKTPNFQKWQKRLGKGFTDTHHYCAALHTLRLSQKVKGTSKRLMLITVTKEIDYMESHVKPGYILFPHIYTTRAEAYIQLKQFVKAFEYFQKAIDTNPKFTKPYALLADFYLSTGNKKNARATLEDGLKHSPQSRQLNKRLKKLSNK